ncbi:hypothetical protein NUW58_g6581 [Xylaria curta]|uniref:Uncharacterized protein n=1 Tax=Xylaria curta TaxID=42375 RepID=A0ACC1NRA9_9PEZI|nr:hypothetical protein NUW58_g6581 [Xylaria curta]
MLGPRSGMLAEALSAGQAEPREGDSSIHGRCADSTATWAAGLPDMIPRILLGRSDVDSLADTVLRIVQSGSPARRRRHWAESKTKCLSLNLALMARLHPNPISATQSPFSIAPSRPS